MKLNKYMLCHVRTGNIIPGCSTVEFYDWEAAGFNKDFVKMGMPLAYILANRIEDGQVVHPPEPRNASA